MKTIGIKLADGSFYPIMQDGQVAKKTLGLTTVNDNQTTVLVDVYRSKSGTMEDAEYIDSLQIDGLVAHPNGTADINLDIGLDEDNHLSAELIDPETGARSNANITLVSRTLEERLEPTNYDVKMPLQEESGISEDFDLPDLGEQETEESAVDPIVDSASEENSFATDDFSLDNTLDDPFAEEPTTAKEENSFATSEESSAADNFSLDDALGQDSFDLPDFGETEVEENPNEEITVPVADEEPISEEDISQQKLAKNGDEENEEIAQDETEKEDDSSLATGVAAGAVAGGLLAAAMLSKKDEEPTKQTEQNSDENISLDDALSSESEDFSLDDTLDAPLSDAADDSVTKTNPLEEDAFDLPDFDATETEENPNEEITVPVADEAPTEQTEQIENEPLPDFDADDALDETFASEEPLDDPFELPNLSETEKSSAQEQTEQEEDSFSLPDFSDEELSETNISGETETNPLEEDTFDLPDFDDQETEENSNEETTDDIFATNDDVFAEDNLVRDNTPSSGINFDGLYDEETVAGDSSSNNEDDETERKTRVPVIICIICAIICILATLLTLFIIPSKYNLLAKSDSKKSKTEQTIEQEEVIIPLEEEKEEVVEVPEVVEAKEDEIVVVAEPEKIVPEPVKEVEEKAQDITYKIKWGDTLWDISNAYYKNPWNYKKIARYNNIKNPDYIISGTEITIPAK